MKRRRFLSGAVAGAALAGAPAIIRSARAADSITVLTPFGFLPDFIELMNAYSGGHFARAGLDVKIIAANGSAQTLQLLVAGKAQFGRTSGNELISAVSKQKLPLISISTIYQGSTFQVVSLKDKPILRGEDLKGKTVGLVSVGGATDIFLDLILGKVGLKKDDVKRQYIGNSPGEIDIAKQGRVDCFICTINVVVTLERAGNAITYWSTDKYAPMPSQVLISTRDTANTQPEVTTRFLRAMHASIEEIMTQPIKPIFERAQKDFDIQGLKDLDLAAATEKVIVDELWLSQGKQNVMRNVPALWQTGMNELSSIGLAEGMDATSIYTNRYIDEALKS